MIAAAFVLSALVLLTAIDGVGVETSATPPRIMLLKILVVLAVLIGLFLLYAAMQPSTFRITRDIIIAAPAEAVFVHGNSLPRAQAWSPWKKLDPSATFTFSGPESGVGSRIEWAGNNQIGAGRQTITESVPNQRVRSRVEFIRPFAGSSEVEFRLEAINGQTRITWGLAGTNNFLARVICVFMNQDKMLGTPLSEGLLSLKHLVETGREG